MATINPNDISISPFVTNQVDEASKFQAQLNALGTVQDVQAQVKQYQTGQASISTLRFPANETGKYYMRMEIADYNRTGFNTVNLTVNSASSTDAVIILPMPAKLENSSEVSYKKAEIGTPLGALGSTAGSAIGATKAAQAGNTQAAQDFLNQGWQQALGAAAAGGISLLNDAVTGIGKQLVGPALTGAEAFLGYVPNQYYTILLVGPEFNQYQFIWTFFPKNHDDSVAIKNIYYKIMNAKAPQGAFGGVLWKFPKIFRLSYFPNSQFLNKFKPAVVKDVQWNFAPGGIGTPAFYAGADNPPEAVSLAITFWELEYWLASDYTDNNNPIDTLGPSRGVP